MSIALSGVGSCPLHRYGAGISSPVSRIWVGAPSSGCAVENMISVSSLPAPSPVLASGSSALTTGVTSSQNLPSIGPHPGSHSPPVLASGSSALTTGVPSSPTVPPTFSPVGFCSPENDPSLPASVDRTLMLDGSILCGADCQAPSNGGCPSICNRDNCLWRKPSGNLASASNTSPTSSPSQPVSASSASSRLLNKCTALRSSRTLAGLPVCGISPSRSIDGKFSVGVK